MVTAAERDKAIKDLQGRVAALEAKPAPDLSSYATTAQLNAEAGTRKVADDDLGARIAKLENPTVPPVDPKPTVSGIAVSAITQTSAQISWSLSEPCSGQVEYGTTTAYGAATITDPNLLSSHSQNISGLLADTTYFFRVRSKDSAGQEVISSGSSFKTAAVIVVPPPTGKVVTFSGGSATSFATLCKDTSIDVIEMTGGTYPSWACFLDVDRTSAHPLLVRPATNANVVWDGTGTINTPPFRIGWSTKASYITFDPAGTGGSFTAQNYKLGKAGLIMGRYFDHITFNGLIVRNVEGGFGDGIPGQQQHTHAVYIMGGDGKYWTSNDWDVVGPANKMLNGFQTDGAPNADFVVAKGWKVRSLNRAVYAWSDPTGYVIDGWTITDCNVTIDNNKGQQASKGVVRNCKATNSGPLAVGQGWWGGTQLTDGGGNTSA